MTAHTDTYRMTRAEAFALAFQAARILRHRVHGRASAAPTPYRLYPSPRHVVIALAMRG